MQVLLQAYFSPIETALGIEKGQLWTDERGKAFAGYAPILSSIGTLLAHVDNPLQVTNRLRVEGSAEAWDVIATVVEEILEREQKKLTDKLPYVVEPKGAYGPEEQLTYLTQLFQRQPLQLVDDLHFQNASDEFDYRIKVEQMRTEHPFVRDSKFANDVLGSKVLAHAAVNDLLGDDLDMIKTLSRQPFLWRFFRKLVTDPSFVLDGKYVG